MVEGVAAAPHGEDEATLLARSAAALVAAWSGVPDALSERLSASQLRVLLAVDAAGEVTATQLSQALDVLPSSVTRLCDRLVAAGHVERSRRAGDRRVQVVRLTRTGSALLAQLEQHRTRSLRRVLSAMPETDRAALLRGLNAFAVAARGGGDGRH
jgi:DNA-binding MarR family transcriptional regulator